MIRLVSFLAALALAGCAGNVPPPGPARNIVSSIDVQYRHRDTFVGFAPGKADLSPAEAARLNGFLADAGAPDGLHARLGSNLLDPLGAAREATVATALRKAGIAIESGTAAADLGQVRVELGRYVAVVPDCTVTTYTSIVADSTLTLRAHGCTDLSNFAVMLDDPGDLLAPRRHGAFDAVPAAAAIARYRQDRTTPLMVTQDLPFASTSSSQPANPTDPASPPGTVTP
jgi:pilus biogenesis lipoprotein CpaD